MGFTDETFQSFINEYNANEIFLKDLCVKYNISKTCLWHILKRENIPRRRFKPAGYNLNIGDSFGNFKILSLPYKENHDYWVDGECKCGNSVKIRCFKDGKINPKASKSCGCQASELRHLTIMKDGGYKGYSTTHGGTGTKIYSRWKGMLRRCYDPYSNNNKEYFQKGIKVCEDWHDFEKFRTWAFGNGYDENLVLHRIDSDKNYCPENCKFITARENSRLVTIDRLEQIKKLKQQVLDLTEENSKLIQENNFLHQQIHPKPIEQNEILD